MLIAFFGAVAGLMSGFFGVGGGSIMVPALSVIGFDIKQAIGISVIQMFFGSVFGSFLNHKWGHLNVQQAAPFLYGGLFGGIIGVFLMERFSNTLLYVLFLIILALAILRVFLSPPKHHNPERGTPAVYFAIGSVIGVISGLLGVGGAILLTPILVGFLNFDLKKSINLSLFFVIASSASAFLGLTLFGNVDIENGIIAAAFSLVGVWGGIRLATKVESQRHKKLLLIIYIITFCILLHKALFG